MIGQTTLREIKEALVAARLGEPEPAATALVAELESLSRSLESEACAAPHVPLTEVPPQSLQQQP